MSFWGERFVNLEQAMGPSQVTDLQGEAIAVRAALDRLLAGPLRRGGVLYIPPRSRQFATWPVDVSDALRLPPEVTVWIAPGARLLPLLASRDATLTSGVLRIEGSFRAPMGPCLATPALASRWLDRPMSASQVGRVRLLGPRLERVHPEWWGGGVGDPELDTQALEAAVIAAWYEREGARDRLPSLAVQLLAPLVVRRPLLVMPRPDWTGAMVLRGTMPPREAPSIRAAADFVGTALVVALRHASVSLEGVTLDGATADGVSVADACVALEGQTRDAPVQATLTGCALYGAREAALTWGTESMPARNDARLTLEACTLDAPRVGLRLRGEVASEVDLRGSRLEGAARALVDVQGCALSVTHCVFASAWPAPATILPAVGADLIVSGQGTTVTMDHCASSSAVVVWGVDSGAQGDVSVEVTSLRHVPAGRVNGSLPPAIQVNEGAWGASRLVLDACVFDRPAGAAHAPAVRVQDSRCTVVALGVHPLVPGEGGALVEAAALRRPREEMIFVAPRTQS